MDTDYTTIIEFYGIDPGRKIAAIKSLRSIVEWRDGRHMGLHDAKRAVDIAADGGTVAIVGIPSEAIGMVTLALQAGGCITIPPPRSRHIV